MKSSVNFKRVAFTLIELLVVIAIIGILSGLIVIVMGNMTSKATMAKAQVFSNSLRNSLMLNLVSEWKFDEINSSTTTPDSWSGGNLCTLKQGGYVGICDSTHCPQLQTNECVNGNCLVFDGINDYVDCGSATSLTNVSMGVSGELWIKRSSISGVAEILIDDNGWSSWVNGYALYLMQTSVIYIGAVYTGSWSSVSSGVFVNDTNWHNIAYHIEPNGPWYVYVDGIYHGGTWSHDLKDSTGTFQIGRAHGDGNYFVGLIDNVRIYNAPISTSQVKERYYAGLNSLLASGEITKEEYKERTEGIAVNDN